MGVELYKHNKIAYDKVKEMFKYENRVAVIHPTGCGKSFISLKWLDDNRDKNILFLAPTISIIEQIKKHIIDCEMTMDDFPHLKFLTYSKLSRMDKKSIKKINADMIVLDEFHRCGADEWSKGIASLINCNKNANVLGFSATPIRYLDEHRNMAEELFHGNVASEITLEEAMINGILPVPIYINAVYSFKEDIDYYQDRIEKAKKLDDKLQAQQYLEDARKILEKADGLPKIFQKHIKNKSGKYIVFCRDRNHMKKMMEEAKDWFKLVNDNIDIYQMASFISKKDNLSVFEEFYNSDSDSLKLLFSIDMLNEGVHVPNIDGVIMLRPTESPIIYKQQLGRALSVGHNSNPIVFDIVNNVQSCEMIDKFYKELRKRAITKFNQTGSSEDKSILENFQISDTVRKMQEIFSKIDNCLRIEWDDYYDLACDYYKEHGNLLVPINYSKNGLNLGYWINDQRKNFKGKGHRKEITEQQITKLDNIGMVWDKYKEQWYETYDIAKSWYEQHGNLEMAKGTKIYGKNIYQWLSDQTKSYNNGTLSTKKIQLLEEIGMVWNKTETRWYDMFEIAKAYYDEHGTLLGVKDEKLRNWLAVQKQAYKGTGNRIPLAKDKVKLLESIGMVWDEKEQRFLEMFKLAKEYYEEHGNLIMPDKYEMDGKKISSWIKEKRKAYKKGILSEKQIEMLELIGMIWSVKDKQWNEMYSFAKAYYEEHGNLFVSSKDNKKLLNWLKSQKKLYDTNEMLSKSQRSLLEKIEISNGIKEIKEKKQEHTSRKDIWNLMFEQAEKYYEEHGNLLIPRNDSEYLKIFNWIKSQRLKYNKSLLSPEQIEKLEKIGMIWNIADYQWNLMFEQAKEYYEEHGNLVIINQKSDTKHKKLLTWLNEQKLKYNHEDRASLSEEKIEKLNNIGMVWDVYQDNFDKMFDEAKQYYENFGDLMVPRRNDEYKTLANFIKTMRKKYNEGKLSIDQIKKLESIGMIWDAKQYMWDIMYNQAKEYYEEHGDLSIPRDTPEHKKLVAWIYNKQSGYYGKNTCKLTEEQILQLQGIGLLLDDVENKNGLSTQEYTNNMRALLNVLKEILIECKNNGLSENDVIYNDQECKNNDLNKEKRI